MVLKAVEGSRSVALVLRHHYSPQMGPRLARSKSSRRLLAGIVVLLTFAQACSADPPWMSPSGEIVSASVVLEYTGFRRCDTHRVTFIQFLGRQYANDPTGILGTLESVDGSGRVLTYELVDGLPPATVATGFTRGDRAIYQGPNVEDYLYIVRPTAIERWPRAEVYCEGQHRPTPVG